MPVASILDPITNAIGDHGLYAVFLLMALDAVFPAASELVMVYAGALASGAIAGHGVFLVGFGRISSGLTAYLAMALAGTIGYTVGAVAGWGIGAYGGRPFLERRGRLVHLDAGKLARAEAWFDRYGSWANFLGRVTPVVRSFISIPAGVFRLRLDAYTALTLLGSAIWCFALTAVGWGLGASWERFHHAFRFADYAIAALVLAGIGFLVWKLVKRRRASPGPR